jgi:nitrate/nitrite transport system substrate-binding protein
MSTFDNPFDPNRRLHAGGCSCGQHVSEADHQAAQLQAQSAIESEQKR